MRKVTDTKGVFISRKSTKYRQHNDQKKKDKRTNNDLQNYTETTNDSATQTPTKIKTLDDIVDPL